MVKKQHHLLHDWLWATLALVQTVQSLDIFAHQLIDNRHKDQMNHSAGDWRYAATRHSYVPTKSFGFWRSMLTPILWTLCRLQKPVLYSLSCLFPDLFIMLWLLWKKTHIPVYIGAIEFLNCALSNHHYFICKVEFRILIEDLWIV